MAKLPTKRRDALPKSDFGIPSERKYPMPDPAHAVNAKARATQMANRGLLSDAMAGQIKAKANKVIKRSK